MFELSRVRVIEWFLWESIREGSTRIQKQFELLEVRVIGGSSYWECNVFGKPWIQRTKRSISGLLICRAYQWTGFYMIGTSVLKKLIYTIDIILSLFILKWQFRYYLKNGFIASFTVCNSKLSIDCDFAFSIHCPLSLWPLYVARFP